MRKLFMLVAALVGTLAIAAAPGSAVTGNFVEDNEHPYVGLGRSMTPRASSCGGAQVHF